MRCRATSILCLVLVWLVLMNEGGRAQAPAPTEYQIKAAFLFNFAKFVEWPPAAFPNATAPLVIGVLGKNPFGSDLEKVMQNKLVDEHPLVIKIFSSPREATGCHILFICNSEKERLPEIFKRLKGTSVLTVGEVANFTQSGGMINFVLQGTKTRFQINNEAAVNSGLKISSKLLSLALRPEG
jgi:hypothetical protein